MTGADVSSEQKASHKHGPSCMEASIKITYAEPDANNAHHLALAADASELPCNIQYRTTSRK
jgi:hypothetical protein